VGETETVLEVKDLRKVFHIGFFRTRVEAVNGASFTVNRGEIFGLLGPNGAGKTTTIKAILRLIFPTAGEIRIFGRDAADHEAMKRIGYMPENPYVYQYLKPIEFLDLCGRLIGISKKDRSRRAEEMIDKVGLRDAVDRPIGKFSKGMMQRIGLAQALLHDPELLVLDEPMSGLDPIGRKEVRDLLLEQRRRGKTLLFTSHILSDVEMLCDRVVIMRKGRITSEGQVHDLLASTARRVEIQLSGASRALKDSLRSKGTVVEDAEGRITLQADGNEAVAEILRISNVAGARLEAMIPERQTLESLFLEAAAVETPVATLPERP
jgi:ABC-2 type transport system ATP-binding protein